MKQSVYKTANLGVDYTKENQLFKTKVLSNTPSTIDALDKAFSQTMQYDSKAEMIYIIPSSRIDDPIVTASFPYSLRRDHQSNFYFNPDGSLLKKVPFNIKSKGLRLIESCYGIHTGQLFNLFGKCIVFLTSLLIASLAVTGIFIWTGKFNKAKNT